MPSIVPFITYTDFRACARGYRGKLTHVEKTEITLRPKMWMNG